MLPECSVYSFRYNNGYRNAKSQVRSGAGPVIPPARQPVAGRAIVARRPRAGVGAPPPAPVLETTMKASAAAPRKPGPARASTMVRGERPLVVYEQLRDLIVHGHLAPGSRIVESDVAGRLGVSRTPVRGALQRLQQ